MMVTENCEGVAHEKKIIKKMNQSTHLMKTCSSRALGGAQHF